MALHLPSPRGALGPEAFFDVISALVPDTIGFTCTAGDTCTNVNPLQSCQESLQADFVLYNMAKFNNDLNSMNSAIGSTQQ
jgi:hypothetical protein